MHKRIFKKEDDEPIPLTGDGLKHLRERMASLKRALPDLIAEAQRTAAYGDRSDNAEYKEAKSTLRRTQGQIFRIEDQLKRIEVIKRPAHAPNTIQLGSMAVLETEGKEKTYEILGPHETDPARGRISNKSPLGAALMGRAKGDIVMIETENGSRTYRILAIY